MNKNIGQVNYESYHGDISFSNWDDLGASVKESWLAGAVASVKAYISQKFGEGGDMFLVASSYGQEQQKGYVEIKFREEIAQLDPDVAREIARDLLDAAAAAETDAFLMTFLTKRTGLDAARGALVLNEFRKWRKELV
jgi:hypothetical protein